MPRRLAVLAALALAAPAPLAAEAVEEILRIPSRGMEMAATLSLPSGDPAPVVLLFHGFTGSRDELPIEGLGEGVFARTARLLAEAGFASLRVDFLGSGESDGAFADTSFEGQIADGLAAVDFLLDEPRVRGEALGIIGWSMGGLVAAGVAARSPAPDAVALWAAVSTPRESFGDLFGADVLEAGRQAGPEGTALTLPWGAQITMGPGFFEGIATHDPLADIAAYEGPLFIAHGTADDVVLPVAAERFAAAHPGETELWIAKMDHVFNVFTGPDTLDAMVAATIAFLARHLD